MARIMSPLRGDDGALTDTHLMWAWYLVYIVPILLFACYGVFKLDAIAVMAAFVAWLFFMLWMVHGGIRSTKQLKAIFAKYHAIVQVESEKSTNFGH